MSPGFVSRRGLGHPFALIQNWSLSPSSPIVPEYTPTKPNLAILAGQRDQDSIFLRDNVILEGREQQLTRCLGPMTLLVWMKYCLTPQMRWAGPELRERLQMQTKWSWGSGSKHFGQRQQLDCGSKWREWVRGTSLKTRVARGDAKQAEMGKVLENPNTWKGKQTRLLKPVLFKFRLFSENCCARCAEVRDAH